MQFSLLRMPELFWFLSSSHFFSPKILGFFLPTKNNLTWVVNCEKLNFKNFIRWASKIVHEWNGHLEVFSRPQVIENSRQYSLLRSMRYFKGNSRWVPFVFTFQNQFYFSLQTPGFKCKSLLKVWWFADQCIL